MSVVDLNSQLAFEEFINDSECAVVLFTSDWCGPCATAVVEFNYAAGGHGDVINFARLDVDKYYPDDVKSVPTFIRYDQGQVYKKVFGARPHKYISGGLDLWKRARQLRGDDSQSVRFHREDITAHRHNTNHEHDIRDQK